MNTGAGAKDAVSEPIATPMIAGNAQIAHHLGDHRAFSFVPKIGAHCRWHDNRQRSANAHLDANLFRHIQYAKYFVQNWHDDGAAANSEQSSKNTHQNASARYQERKQGDLAKRISEQHDSSRKTARRAKSGGDVR